MATVTVAQLKSFIEKCGLKHDTRQAFFNKLHVECQDDSKANKSAIEYLESEALRNEVGKALHWQSYLYATTSSESQAKSYKQGEKTNAHVFNDYCQLMRKLGHENQVKEFKERYGINTECIIPNMENDTIRRVRNNNNRRNHRKTINDDEKSSSIKDNSVLTNQTKKKRQNKQKRMITETNDNTKRNLKATIQKKFMDNASGNQEENNQWWESSKGFVNSLISLWSATTSDENKKSRFTKIIKHKKGMAIMELLIGELLLDGTFISGQQGVNAVYNNFLKTLPIDASQITAVINNKNDVPIQSSQLNWNVSGIDDNGEVFVYKDAPIRFAFNEIFGKRIKNLKKDPNSYRLKENRKDFVSQIVYQMEQFLKGGDKKYLNESREAKTVTAKNAPNEQTNVDNDDNHDDDILRVSPENLIDFDDDNNDGDNDNDNNNIWNDNNYNNKARLSENDVDDKDNELQEEKTKNPRKRKRRLTNDMQNLNLMNEKPNDVDEIDANDFHFGNPNKKRRTAPSTSSPSIPPQIEQIPPQNGQIAASMGQMLPPIAPIAHVPVPMQHIPMGHQSNQHDQLLSQSNNVNPNHSYANLSSPLPMHHFNYYNMYAGYPYQAPPPYLGYPHTGSIPRSQFNHHIYQYHTSTDAPYAIPAHALHPNVPPSPVARPIIPQQASHPQSSNTDIPSWKMDNSNDTSSSGTDNTNDNNSVQTDHTIAN